MEASSLEGFLIYLIQQGDYSEGTVTIFTLLIFLIKILLFYVIVKLAVYHGMTKAIKQNLNPQMSAVIENQDKIFKSMNGYGAVNYHNDANNNVPRGQFPYNNINNGVNSTGVNGNNMG